jgi:hypothetical protein
MYYQQLLFWGFALIAAGGAGRYSIDSLIMKPGKSNNSSPAIAPLAV